MLSLSGFTCLNASQVAPKENTKQESERDITSMSEQLSRSLPLLSKNGIAFHKDFKVHEVGSKTLYFGTGLCTTKEMSAGITFDFLGLLATAHTIRKVCGFQKVIHLIADTHAKSNRFVSDEEVDKKAHEFKNVSLLAARNLGLVENHEVILASEIDASPTYKNIFGTIPSHAQHEYVRRQWADMEYFAQKHNTCLKLSWMLPLKKNQAHRSDEAFFDVGFTAQFQRPYSFIYNKASLTFNPSRLNVCPYTYIKGESRLLLDAEQDAETKLNEFCTPPHKAKDKALEEVRVTVEFLETFLQNTTTPKGTLGCRVNNIVRSVSKTV